MLFPQGLEKPATEHEKTMRTGASNFGASRGVGCSGETVPLRPDPPTISIHWRLLVACDRTVGQLLRFSGFAVPPQQHSLQFGVNLRAFKRRRIAETLVAKAVSFYEFL